MKNRKLGILFLAVCLLALAGVVFLVFGSRIKQVRLFLNLPAKEEQPAFSDKVFPTKTPQEIEIISKIETKRVDVMKSGIEPQSLTIKLYDQVAFYNKTGVEIRVVGEDWGNIKIADEENMTQAFAEVGEFTYKVTGLGKELSGKIVVQ